MKNLKIIVLFSSFLTIAGMLTACSGSEITASAVNDEGSLEDFVYAAKEHVETDYEQAIVDFREKGKWRHGGVYIFIMDEYGETYLHSENPILEGREGSLVDLDTGEPLKPKVLKAGLRREGGFIKYTFDNPEIEGKDRSTKISFVLPFKKRQEDKNFIIGAGFYPDDN